MKPGSKLVKVVLEFEDEIKTLKGIEAESWIQACNSLSIMGAVHGQIFPKFNWKIKKKK